MLNAKDLQLTAFSEKASFKSYSVFRSFSWHGSHFVVHCSGAPPAGMYYADSADRRPFFHVRKYWAYSAMFDLWSVSLLLYHS